MNRTIVALLAVFAALILLKTVDYSSTSVQFQRWKTQFAVNFENNADQLYRKHIFQLNLAKIQAHNSNPSSTYRMGINQFTIYTEQEFQERFLNHRIQNLSPKNIINHSDSVRAVIIDWTERGAVGQIRNQGTCGSGVLYATLGAAEGLSKVSTGTLQNFSAQQLMDCVFGCAGSQPNKGFDYYKIHGACTQGEYPSKGSLGTCQNKTCGFKISGYKMVNTCDALINAIQIEPIAVAVDASKWASYSSGIFSNCGTSINHLTLLTGLADEYWKCKNSWGTAWGERGYIRLARGNTCGICSYASYPLH